LGSPKDEKNEGSILSNAPMDHRHSLRTPGTENATPLPVDEGSDWYSKPWVTMPHSRTQPLRNGHIFPILYLPILRTTGTRKR
jgi:hypothetical protein